MTHGLFVKKVNNYFVAEMLDRSWNKMGTFFCFERNSRGEPNQLGDDICFAIASDTCLQMLLCWNRFFSRAQFLCALFITTNFVRRHNETLTSVVNKLIYGWKHLSGANFFRK